MRNERFAGAFGIPSQETRSPKAPANPVACGRLGTPVALTFVPRKESSNFQEGC